MDDDDITVTGSNTIDISNAPLWSPMTLTGGEDFIIDTSIDTSCWDNTVTIAGTGNASVKLGKDGIDMDEECDVKIGDRSLKEFMDQVEERLNILHPNPKLEEKWNDLAELGKRYRKLEAEILEKERMWKILKDR